jgi:hypothetical protein
MGGVRTPTLGRTTGCVLRSKCVDWAGLHTRNDGSVPTSREWKWEMQCLTWPSLSLEHAARSSIMRPYVAWCESTDATCPLSCIPPCFGRSGARHRQRVLDIDSEDTNCFGAAAALQNRWTSHLSKTGEKQSPRQSNDGHDLDGSSTGACKAFAAEGSRPSRNALWDGQHENANATLAKGTSLGNL